MRAYQAERVENAMAFFIREHKKKTQQRICQTSLWKYLSFFEYRTLKTSGKMPLGLKYGALDHGPVPMDLYSKVTSGDLASSLFRVIKEPDRKVFFEPEATPDMDYFTENEITEMNNLIEIFAQRWITSKVMSDASHQEMRSWRITHKERANAIIDWTLEFPRIHEKSLDSLTDTEEQFLMNESLARLGAV